MRKKLVVEIYLDDPKSVGSVRHELTTRINLALNIEKARQNLTHWEWEMKEVE